MKKKRERAVRREMERDHEKLTRVREKLAEHEPGGSPERAVVVDSASQIEGRAAMLRCLRCERGLKVREHRAIAEPSLGTLREVELECAHCKKTRLSYYRVGSSLN